MSAGAARRRVLLAHPAGWIASGFGSGFSPVAPGTAGSLAALLPWFALRELPPFAYASAVVLAFALGVWACAWTIGAMQLQDPSLAVWDEFVGLWIALAPLPAHAAGWMWICAGFILFRMFDIAKPWPVSWADRRVGGGLGVMLDDAFAGACAALVLEALLRWQAV